MVLIPRPGYVRQILVTKTRLRKGSFRLHEIEAVLAHYDLGRWRVCRALGGTSSHNLLLQTDQGQKVLKHYHWSLPSTQQEHSILRHLAGTDFPTPGLEINKKGLTITESGDQHYAIYNFINGYSYTNYFLPSKTRRRMVAQAGQMLARLHQLMTGFIPAGRKVNGFKPDGGHLWRDVDWHLSVLDQYVQPIGQQKSSDAGDTFLLSIAAELRRDIIELGRYFEQPSKEFPKLVIHGDYAPHNVLFNRGRLVTVLDFGDACINLRALDIARGLTSFSRVNWGRRDKFNIDKPLADIFLRAYQAQHPLSDEEIKAIPDLMRWRLLQPLIWKLNGSRPNRGTSKGYDISLRRNWETADRLKIHGNELQASLLSLKRD